MTSSARQETRGLSIGSLDLKGALPGRDLAPTSQIPDGVITRLSRSVSARLTGGVLSISSLFCGPLIPTSQAQSPAITDDRSAIPAAGAAPLADPPLSPGDAAKLKTWLTALPRFQERPDGPSLADGSGFMKFLKRKVGPFVLTSDIDQAKSKVRWPDSVERNSSFAGVLAGMDSLGPVITPTGELALLWSGKPEPERTAADRDSVQAAFDQLGPIALVSNDEHFGGEASSQPPIISSKQANDFLELAANALLAAVILRSDRVNGGTFSDKVKMSIGQLMEQERELQVLSARLVMAAKSADCVAHLAEVLPSGFAQNVLEAEKLVAAAEVADASTKNGAGSGGKVLATYSYNGELREIHVDTPANELDLLLTFVQGLDLALNSKRADREQRVSNVIAENPAFAVPPRLDLELPPSLNTDLIMEPPKLHALIIVLRCTSDIKEEERRAKEAKKDGSKVPKDLVVEVLGSYTSGGIGPALQPLQIQARWMAAGNKTVEEQGPDGQKSISIVEVPIPTGPGTLHDQILMAFRALADTNGDRFIDENEITKGGQDTCMAVDAYVLAVTGNKVKLGELEKAIRDGFHMPPKGTNAQADGFIDYVIPTAKTYLMVAAQFAAQANEFGKNQQLPAIAAATLAHLK